MRVAVIGAGISGLTGAYRLLQHGHEVTVFERAPAAGGLGAHFTFQGVPVERFYHCMIPSDAALLGLLEELGLADRVYWSEVSMGFMVERRMYPLNTPRDLLRFGPLRVIDRIRVGLGALYMRLGTCTQALETVPALSWLERLFGKRATALLYRPLLEAKFGAEYAPQVPAAWYVHRFRREKASGREVKGYIRGSYEVITRHLLVHLHRMGAKIRFNQPVQRLWVHPDGSLSVDTPTETHRFDAALLAVPYPVARRIIQNSPRLANLLKLPEIPHMGVVNAVLILKRSLIPHYWMPVVRSGVRFQGIVQSTHVRRPEELGGRHLVYLMNYLPASDEWFHLGDEQLRERYWADLRALFPDLREADLEEMRLFRTSFVEPNYTLGYAETKPSGVLLPGLLYLATPAQVYPNPPSWNAMVAQVEEVARWMVQDLALKAPQTMREEHEAVRRA
ncbi:MAG: FAD-dependent oxidoreductase [Bacteroidetes bacterium]|nr:FAD-dependent oxidoreductase [Rhodothermia bacterium]MCX7906764.1 FAD-dependent oxidoreductase [Bacteroidota bacterium]MDW8136956.1 FAD-dependent oxidoreductase [Bacteroidota bacterium]MDW8285173.1 FAD-dependent oxidoreductase [Bacteroidota bacterium]